MADRNLRVRIGLDTTGLTAAADAAAAAFNRVAAAAAAAGTAAQAGAGRGAAAAATQAEAAKASAVTQESLIRSTAQAAVVAAQAETDAAARSAAARMAATEAALAVQEAAYKTAMAVAQGASEAEIAAARSVVAAQATASAEAAAAVKAAAAEETAAAEASAAAQVAAARRVAEAQAIAATAALPASRAAAAEARAASVAAVAANRAAAAEATAAAGAAEGAATRAAGAGSMMGLGIAAGVFMIGKSIISQTRDYELAMNTLQGVTGAGAATMAHAGEVAKQLGADITIPGASASDAAHAMLELSKAGFTVVQSEDAAKASLQLAATAQVDAGKAAEFMGQSLNMFGLGADQASHASDVLANVANAASGNITDFMYALNAAGPASHALGVSLDDTATTMGMLAKAGILGSNAGTEYARMLQSMERPSKKAQQALDDLGISAFTASGQFVGMPVIIDELSKAHARMTPQAYAAAASIAFGAHAVKAAVTLGAEGIPVWDDIAAKIGKVGGNADMATAMMQGLPGAMENIKNNAQNLALTIGGGLSPALSGILNGIAAVIGGFVALPGPVQATALALGAVLLLGGPLRALWLSMSTAIMGFGATTRAVVAEAGVEMSALRAGMIATATTARGMMTSIGASIAANPLGVAIVGLTALWTGAEALSSALSGASAGADTTSTAISTLTGVVDTQTGALKDNAAATISTQLAHDGTIAKVEQAGVAQGDYTAALLGNVEAQKRVEAALQANYAAAAGTAGGIDLNTGAITGNSAAADAASQVLVDYHAKLKAIQDEQATGKISAAQAAAAMYDLSNATDGATTSTDQNTTAQDAAAAAATGAALSAIQLGGAFKDGSVSASELKTQVHDVMVQLDLLAGRNGDAEAAQRAFNQSIRDYSTAQVDAAAAPRTMAEAQLRLADATAKLSDTQGKATSATFTQADKDRALKQAALDVAAAQDAVTKAQINQTKAADNAAQQTADLQSAYISAGQSAYNTAILQGNQTGATDAAAKAMQALKDSFIAAQPEADRANGKAQALADTLFGIPTERAITITANTTPATNEIEALNRMQVADKNFKITATAVGGGGVQITSPSGGTGTITLHANGGLWENGHLVTHAANGLMRQPMIAKGGANIMWAEPETGWEAYISGKPGQEAANRKILGIAAGRLGMSAVMGSDGASAPVITTHSTATHNVYNGGASVSTLAPSDNRVYNIHVTNTAQKPLTPDDIRYLLKQGERS